MWLAAALACAALLALTGCGDDESDPTTGAETVTATVTDEPPPDTTTEAGSGVSTSFQTPSGNIACSMTTEFVNCVIAEASWQPPGDPSCPASAGRFVAFEGGTPEVQCGMPQPPGAEDVLSYGQRSVVGPYRCTSQERGVTCDNLDGSHGLFLSRERVDVR